MTTNRSIISQIVSPPKSPLAEETLRTYQLQLMAFDYALQAAQEDKPLTLKLIQEFHAINVRAQYNNARRQINPYAPPEDTENIAPPGQLRTDIRGSAFLGEEKYSYAGIVEILDLIRSQAKQEPPLEQYHGTWFGPYDAKVHTMKFLGSIRHDTISQLQGDATAEEYAQQIFADIREQNYMMLYFRADTQSTQLQHKLTLGLTALIDKFNDDISTAFLLDDKIYVITQFIQDCLRQLHPFFDGNHRVFVKDVLNFLLLKYGMDICILNDRREIIFYGHKEFLNNVKINLQPGTGLLCDELRTEISQLIQEGPHYDYNIETLINQSEEVDENEPRRQNYFHYNGISKNEFISALRKNVDLLTRLEILDFFSKLKDRHGKYQFIHHQDNPGRDRLRLFFKPKRNDESYFWHTRTYQDAVKLLKAAYLKRRESIPEDKLPEENDFLNYKRGNKIVAPTKARSKALSEKDQGLRMRNGM